MIYYYLKKANKCRLELAQTSYYNRVKQTELKELIRLYDKLAMKRGEL